VIGAGRRLGAVAVSWPVPTGEFARPAPRPYAPEMPRPRLAAVAAALGLVAPAAEAQRRGPAPDEGDVPAEGDRQRREGEYSGVAPPTGQPGAGKRRAAPGTLTWVGFTADAGAGQVFLQAPAEFGHAQRVEGRTLVVTLDGIRRLARNVRRPLDTRYFDSPVARVVVKTVGTRKARKGRAARKAGVEVRITFKTAADAREAAARTAVEADGNFYLYLDLAAGGPVTAPADSDG
jgi:hypothetical protein